MTDYEERLKSLGVNGEVQFKDRKAFREEFDKLPCDIACKLLLEIFIRLDNKLEFEKTGVYKLD